MKQVTKGRTSRRTHGRTKVSTTVSAESFGYLKGLIDGHQARNLAEAIDMAVGRLRRADNRARLERMTEEYFENQPPAALQEENALAESLQHHLAEIDLDV